MDVEPGSGWADAVDKILRMGKNNPESNRILSKAKRDAHGSDGENSDEDATQEKLEITCSTVRLRPNPQTDALLENSLRDAATRGVVHLFNAVKTVNPKSDKKKKKKRKRQAPKKGKKRVKRFRQ